ncbi:MAG: DUF922 domain-containing protein [Vulcanimicrobiaceae bacterium]
MMIALAFAALLALAPAHCNAHPVYRAQPRVTNITMAREGAGYRASASITFVLQAVRPAVLPTDDAALRAHAQGHRAIAERIAAGARGSVMGFGKTPAAARASLDNDVSALTRETNQAIDHQEQTYDRVTDNGAAQDQAPLYGFPGGADVTTPCSR